MSFENIDAKWLLIFAAQLAAGLAIIFVGDPDMRELGIGLIGGAFGAGVTATRTVLK